MAGKKAPVVIEHDEQTESPLTQIANQAAEHSRQIMDTYGDGNIYDRERIIREARFFAAQSAEAILEFGRRLLLIKEHEAHGDFIVIVEQQFGLNPRAAQRFMQGAVKYLSPKLASKATALSHLGKTKLLELIGEDDDDLASLTEGGTVAGMTLDDIDRMSSRELRAALRKAREEAEDQQRVLEDKNKKIDEQAKKINKIRRQDPDQTITDMRTAICAMQSNIEFDIRTNFFNAINELQTEGGGDHNEFIDSQLKLLEDALSHLRDSFVVAEWEQ